MGSALVLALAAVVKLGSGSQAVVLVSCNNRTDCTEPVQSAFDDPAATDIIIPNAKGIPWIVRPLFLRLGNRTVTLQPGASLVAKRGEFHGTNDCLLTLVNVRNVIIVATGAILQMRKLEYAQPPYRRAEWRHTLSILGCDSVVVHGGTYRDSGGDGLYVAGWSGGPTYSSNVSLLGVVADSSWRNGLSVISADTLLVADSVFTNTNGTNPQCGIDLEPDVLPTGMMRMESITFRNNTLQSNSRCGFAAGLYALQNSSRRVSVLVDGMRVHGCGFYHGRPQPPAIEGGHGSGLYISNYNRKGHGVSGTFRFRDVQIERTNDAGIEIQSWQDGFIQLSFEHTVLTGVAIDQGSPTPDSISPIVIESGSSDPGFRSGSIDFGRNLTIRDGRNRPFLSAGLVGHVEGNFTIINDPSTNPHGCTANLGAGAVSADIRVAACQPQPRTTVNTDNGQTV